MCLYNKGKSGRVSSVSTLGRQSLKAYRTIPLRPRNRVFMWVHKVTLLYVEAPLINFDNWRHVAAYIYLP